MSLDGHGRLSLPSFVTREIGSTSLELVSHSSSHLFLASGRGRERVLLAGSLGEINVTDLLSFCHMFRKTGILRFELQGGRKEIHFDHGDIVSATSTFPEEDLGEVLLELGKLSREELQRGRQSVRGTSEMGRTLVEKGMMTPEDLWAASRYQIESILYNLFTYQNGTYHFSAGTPVGAAGRLSLGTQNIIMEGLRRVDERALFMGRLRSLESVAVCQGTEEGLDPAETRMLTLAKERRSVRDLLRLAGMGEFDGLRLLYQLVEKGRIRMEDPPQVPVPGRLGEILAICNGALGTIFAPLTRKNPLFAQELRSFLRNLPQPYAYLFRDVSLREDGTLEEARLVANMTGLEEPEQEKLLVGGLGEVIYMVCCAARRDLGGEADALVRRVQEVPTRVKNIIRRKE